MRIMTTDRLALDEFDANDDADFLVELLNEPSFIDNIRDTGVRTTADAAAYVREGPAASYRSNGFGLWRMSLLDAGDVIGMCGLVMRDFLPAPDLGFALLRRHHGQGYAEEAARAVLKHADASLGLDRLLAIVSPSNVSSRRLLTKLGFRETCDAPGVSGTILLERHARRQSQA